MNTALVWFRFAMSPKDLPWRPFSPWRRFLEGEWIWELWPHQLMNPVMELANITEMYYKLLEVDLVGRGRLPAVGSKRMHFIPGPFFAYSLYDIVRWRAWPHQAFSATMPCLNTGHKQRSHVTPHKSFLYYFNACVCVWCVHPGAYVMCMCACESLWLKVSICLWSLSPFVI